MRKILRGAKIIDCLHLEPLDGFEIIIEGNKILSINKKTDNEFPDDTVIDLSGKTILPGLINMHVHLIGDDEKNFMINTQSKSDEQLLLQAVKAANLSLMSGVTTLRDCGCRNNVVHWLRDSINQRQLIGPRIISSGMMITATGGHCYFMGIEADGKDEIRKAVRLLIKSGSDFIKIMVTGGGGTPNTDKRVKSFTDKELHTAIDEAHRHGKKVGVHAHGTRGIRQSADLGVDIIEHCSFITDEGGRKAENDILELMKEKSISIVPTISSHIGLIFKGPFTLENFSKMIHDNLEYYYKRWEIFKDQYKSGVTILAGNDAGTTGTPHDNFITHLEMMVALGMKEKEVINSATCVAAKALGLEKEIGKIEAGKVADLIAVEGNPLEDIHALRNLDMVMVGGERILA